MPVKRRARARAAFITCRLLGIGAMNSPRFRPAGLLIEHAGARVMIDGGGGAEPTKRVDAWLVTDARAELMREIRIAARRWNLEPRIDAFRTSELWVLPKLVVHTSHPTYGYLIRADGCRIAWAPEFFAFPRWAHDVDVMFGEAAGFSRPIRFAGGVGGHMAALDISRKARAYRVGRLVFAHIGRPSIRAMDSAEPLAYGEWGVEGRAYRFVLSR